MEAGTDEALRADIELSASLPEERWVVPSAGRGTLRRFEQATLTALKVTLPPR